MVVILSEVKDLLLILGNLKPRSFGQNRPQDDKEGQVIAQHPGGEGSMVVILSGAKDLLLVLERPQPEILRRCAPQDDKEGAIPSGAGSMLAIPSEAIASPEGKDLLLVLEVLNPRSFVAALLRMTKRVPS